MRAYDDLWLAYNAGAVPLVEVFPDVNQMTGREIVSALAESEFCNVLSFDVLSHAGQATNPVVLGLRNGDQNIGPWVGIAVGPKIVLAFKDAGGLAIFRLMLEA